MRLDGIDVPVQHAVCKPAYCLDPLRDLRWERFLAAHPRASMFHSSSWLAALRKTYGYECAAYTTARPGAELENAIVFAKVESWLTGRRLVSLPFSDHSEPLVDWEDDAQALESAVREEFERDGWDYIEIRPLRSFPFMKGLRSTQLNYSYHVLDLAPETNAIFENFHKSSTQRKIRRAEREGLTYREGSSEEFVDEFYRLFLLTRRRHQLPPQPKMWFQNLVESFGDALKIRLALKGGKPVAAILTIGFKDTLSYKYGACDARFNNLGCMHMLLWNAIREAKASGLRYFDFGRSNAGQESLITFKNRWGAAQSRVTYVRYGLSERSTNLFDLSAAQWKADTTKWVVSHLPSRMVSKIGELLYGHIG